MCGVQEPCTCKVQCSMQDASYIVQGIVPIHSLCTSSVCVCSQFSGWETVTNMLQTQNVLHALSMHNLHALSMH